MPDPAVDAIHFARGRNSLIHSILAATPLLALWAYSRLSGDDHGWGVMLLGVYICLPATAFLSVVALIFAVIAAAKSPGLSAWPACLAAAISLVTLIFIFSRWVSLPG